MADTTWVSLVNAVEALSIGGVAERHKQGPPASVQRLPCQYANFPSGDRPAVAKDTKWATKRVDLVVLVEAAGQGTQPQNFDATIRMMDALETALDGLAAGKTKPTWSMRLSQEMVAGSAYWGVVATVEIDG